MTNNCQLSRTVTIDKSLLETVFTLQKSAPVTMADYPWPAYYYVDYDYLDNSIRNVIRTEPRKENVEFVLAIALPIVFILGFIG